MRPESIVTFEQIMLGTLVLGLVQAWLSWETAIAKAPTVPHLVGFLLILLILANALVLTLTLLVSRQRSKVAKWISVILFVIGMPMVAKQVTHGGSLPSLTIIFLQIIGQIVAYGLLFTPSAREWLNEGR